MSKTINFSDLKRKKIYKTLDGGIEIYNPNKEQTSMIQQMLIDSFEKNDGKIEINGKDVLLKLMRELTNITIDYDDEDLIDEILDDPSDVLIDVCDILTEMIEKTGARFNKLAKRIEKMSDEDIKKIVKQTDPKHQKKQQLLDELQKREQERKAEEERIKKELEELDIEDGE